MGTQNARSHPTHRPWKHSLLDTEVLWLGGDVHPGRDVRKQIPGGHGRDRNGKRPRGNYRFASDLGWLDQYNYCGCEVVVTDPITNLEAMWEALETVRDALWERVREFTGYDLNQPASEILSSS